MPLASRQHATGVKGFIWVSGNCLQGQAVAETGHSVPEAGCAWESNTKGCGQESGPREDAWQGTAEADLFGNGIETHVDHFRCLLVNSFSICTILFSFQLPFYFGKSS